MKKDDEIKALKKKIGELRERNTALHDICTRQRDSLAAQQETIVKLTQQETFTNLTIQRDSILACLCEVYGSPYPQKDGTFKKQMSFPVDRYPDALARFQVSAVKEDGQFVISIVPRPREDEGPQEAAPETEDADGQM